MRRSVLFTMTIASLALAATPAAASAATPPGLTGEQLTLTQADATGTSVTCAPGPSGGQINFAGSGTATGPYPGTFTVRGAATTNPDGSGAFSETFAITSTTGTVTGNKSGALPAGTSTCVGSDFVADQIPADYEARIVTASGTFADSGTSQQLLEVSGDVSPPTVAFDETFSSSGVVSTGPTSTDQCKNGGWRQYPQFKNQGDCNSFVQNGG